MQQQFDAAHKYFHGEGALVSEVEKFMSRDGNYRNMWVNEATNHGSLKTIPDRLYCQQSKVYAVWRNVIGCDIEKAHTSKLTRCSGRSICNYAVATMQESKKMLSLIPD